jgi:hypothetical protein
MKLDRSIPNEFYTVICKFADKDMRIGQLFSNLSSYISTEHGIDIFYVENDELTDYLEEYFGKMCGKKSNDTQIGDR